MGINHPLWLVYDHEIYRNCVSDEFYTLFGQIYGSFVVFFGG